MTLIVYTISSSAMVAIQAAGAETFEFAGKWGSDLSLPGSFNGQSGIAVDSEGDVYVTDTFNYRVQKFSSDGTFIAKWNSSDTDGGFATPVAIATDSENNVYVSEYDGNHIQKLGSNGTLIAAWGTRGNGDGQM